MLSCQRIFYNFVSSQTIIFPLFKYKFVAISICIKLYYACFIYYEACQCKEDNDIKQMGGGNNKKGTYGVVSPFPSKAPV